MYYFAVSGNYLLFLIVILICLYSLATHNLQLTTRSFFIAVLALGIGTLIKHYFYLPRPFLSTGMTPLGGYLMDGSFPSDHTALAFALSLPVFIQHRRFGMLLILLSCLVAGSRVIAGVHSLYDVFGGFILALALTLVTQNARLLKIWHFL
jgi:undecaprenyl-diphosphatase